MNSDRRRPPGGAAPDARAAEYGGVGHVQPDVQAHPPLPPGPTTATAAPPRNPAAPPRLRSRIESLRLIETACWQELTTAARERGHGWRLMTLATIDGDRADARSVVLREVDAARRKVLFYTDARSPKVAQVRAHPQGTAVAWCPTLSWQVRLHVRLAIEAQTPATRQRWSRLQMTPGAQDYMSPLAPGQALHGTSHESDAREHFAILEALVEGVDWLELHADGHRRAVFDPGGARWVQP